MAVTITDRSGDTQRYFSYFADDPQRSAKFQDVVYQCKTHAMAMIEALADGHELTDGLRKLVEATDCFLRAARL